MAAARRLAAARRFAAARRLAAARRFAAARRCATAAALGDGGAALGRGGSVFLEVVWATWRKPFIPSAGWIWASLGLSAPLLATAIATTSTASSAAAASSRPGARRSLRRRVLGRATGVAAPCAWRRAASRADGSARVRASRRRQRPARQRRRASPASRRPGWAWAPWARPSARAARRAWVRPAGLDRAGAGCATTSVFSVPSLSWRPVMIWTVSARIRSGPVSPSARRALLAPTAARRVAGAGPRARSRPRARGAHGSAGLYVGRRLGRAAAEGLGARATAQLAAAGTPRAGVLVGQRGDAGLGVGGKVERLAAQRAQAVATRRGSRRDRGAVAAAVARDPRARRPRRCGRASAGTVGNHSPATWRRRTRARRSALVSLSVLPPFLILWIPVCSLDMRRPSGGGRSQGTH